MSFGSFNQQTQNNPWLCLGTINADGTVEDGFNISCNRPLTGRYNITFNNTILDWIPKTTYPVLVTILGTNTRDDYMTDVINRTVNGFQVRVSEQDNGGAAGRYRNVGFSVFAAKV